MLAFLGKAAYCLAAAGLLSAISAGSFLIGYRGGYEQALHDEEERFPTLVLGRPPTAEWAAFLDERPKLPPWLYAALANRPPLRNPKLGP